MPNDERLRPQMVYPQGEGSTFDADKLDGHHWRDLQSYVLEQITERVKTIPTGAQGPVGPAGPQGVAGPAGADGTTTTYTIFTPVTEDNLQFSDILTVNASTSMHGLLPKLPGGTGVFLRGDGTWAAPPGGSGGPDPYAYAWMLG